MATYILYLICELVSILLLYFACKSKNYKNQNKNSIKKNTVLFILSMLPFTLLFFLRSSDVGTDYKLYANAYLSNYHNTLTPFESDWLGIGFKIICSAFGFVFGTNYHIPFAIINIITLFLFQYTIYKQSEHPIFSLLILYTFCFHLQIFNQFRQFLAIAICFWNLKYLKNEKFFKYFIGILIASMFHSSAIVLLIGLIFKNRKINSNIILVYLVIGMFFAFGYNLIEYLISLTHYSVYIDSNYDIQTLSSKLNLLIRLIMLVLCFTQYKKISSNSKTNNVIFLFHMIVWCLLFQILSVHSYILARLTTYFYISYILLIPVVFKSFISGLEHKKEKILITYFLIILLFSYKTIYYYSEAGSIGGGYGEYSTFISKGENR